jgi:hypothetical protein
MDAVRFSDVSDWMKNGLLPTVLLALGALLFVRLVQWIGARYRSGLGAEIRITIESGKVASEQVKRSRAVAEVLEWSAVPVPAGEDLDVATKTLRAAADALANDDDWAGLLRGRPVSGRWPIRRSTVVMAAAFLAH